MCYITSYTHNTVMFLSIQVRACSNNMPTTKQSVTRTTQTAKRKLALSAQPQPIVTDTPNLGRVAKLHSDKKGNHAAHDLMLKAKQSTVKQDCNPISINLEGHTQKTSTPLVALPKKQPWIDNDLVKLSTADHTIIKSPTGWLSDSIIDAAQKTLQEQFGLPGFQSVLHGQCCNFNVEPDEFIQILHNGSNHWVTVSTIGTKHPEVFVYDNMYTKAPDRLQQQIAALLHTKEEAITLKFTKVNVQSNSNDCGVFAIAFATALCHGTSPAQLLFDESKMRHHLLKCLEQGCFTMFPVRQRSRMVTVKAVQYIPIHCTCRMPSIDGIDMIECTACKDWFHVHCASPSTSVLNCTDLPWHCDICTA